MSDGSAALRARIASAADLQSMARTMKSIAAANIGQFVAAADALDRYVDVVQDSLAASLRATPGFLASSAKSVRAGLAGAVVFGSDQGLVGQFNEKICAQVRGSPQHSHYARLWPVGERVTAILREGGGDGAEDGGTLHPFVLPASIDAVSALVGKLLIDIEASCADGGVTTVDLHYHRPDLARGYVPSSQRLLPMDAAWLLALRERPWPTAARPQVLALGHGHRTLRACVREYLFISLFRACAASLASENAARLAAMQRAEKNIGENLARLTQTFHRQRQGAIDDELFDLVAGFEAQQPMPAGPKRANTQN